MKKLNLYFGLALFVTFLLTGQYMEHVFKPLHFDEHVVRMQARASHIYILFISLLNILAFKCELSGSFPWKKYAHVGFRLLVVLSGILMVFAFFFESKGDMINRSLTKTSAICSIAAVGVVLIHETVRALMKRRVTE